MHRDFRSGNNYLFTKILYLELLMGYQLDQIFQKMISVLLNTMNEEVLMAIKIFF